MGQARKARRATTAAELAAIKVKEVAFREAMNHPHIYRIRRGLWSVGYRAIEFAQVLSKSAAIRLRQDLRKAAHLHA